MVLIRLMPQDLEACRELVGNIDNLPLFLEGRHSIGAFTQSGDLIGVCLAAPYKEWRLKHKGAFDRFFNISGRRVPFSNEVHVPLLSVEDPNILYLHTLYVSPKYRKEGVGTRLVTDISKGKYGTIACTVNSDILPMFMSSGFHIQQLNSNTFFAMK